MSDGAATGICHVCLDEGMTEDEARIPVEELLGEFGEIRGRRGA